MSDPAFRNAPRAVIFDLDETLIDSRRAWQYAVEESVAGVCGRRVDASGLCEEYRRRPWAHALRILVDDERALGDCERSCAAIFGRSALKRLLVHDGVGMALDRLRAGRVEVGAISRERHGLARLQIESTGLDRFLSVLIATTDEGSGGIAGSLERACAFLGREPNEVAFIGADTRDLAAAEMAGTRVVFAGWASRSSAKADTSALAHPRELAGIFGSPEAGRRP